MQHQSGSWVHADRCGIGGVTGCLKSIQSGQAGFIRRAREHLVRDKPASKLCGILIPPRFNGKGRDRGQAGAVPPKTGTDRHRRDTSGARTRLASGSPTGTTLASARACGPSVPASSLLLFSSLHPIFFSYPIPIHHHHDHADCLRWTFAPGYARARARARANIQRNYR